jgi:thiosulfate/3-mercaptopyruvate sulfurtransferase
LEAWEKVFVEDAAFLTSIHNSQNCIGCHGGVDGASDKDAAHEGVVRDPTSDPNKVCGSCHSTEVEMASTGLHQNLSGYHTTLEQRGADFSDSNMLEGFNNHCATCHASCGQCHVSRPNFTDGGLIAGHKVKEFASMTDTCMACHGARVANEYKGLNEGVPGSVHWLDEGMPCYQCHKISDYHGDGTENAHRYDGNPSPRCEDCHAEETSERSEVLEHTLHQDKVSCNVCHVSGPYKNCYNCHVGLDEKELPFYTTDESQMAFKIGRNPLQSEERPWEYVLVRHVPVEPDTFEFYGDDLLPDFHAVATWKYATPHNIQRITPQNESCNQCHGNEELFLTADDVEPDRRQANASVIVEQVPPQAHTGLADNVEPQVCADITEFKAPRACVGCHPGAVEDDWGLLSQNLHPLSYLVEPAGDVILCQDCHSPEGNFDWAAAGFGDEEAAEFIWSDFPEIESPEQPSSGPVWLLGIGLVIAVVTATPFVLWRNGAPSTSGVQATRREQDDE